MTLITCPQCQERFEPDASEGGPFFLCPGCGARLASRRPTTPPLRTQSVATERLKAAVAQAVEKQAQHAPEPDAGRAALRTPSGGGVPMDPKAEETSVREMLRAVQRTQQEILELLRERLPPASGAAARIERPGDVTLLPAAPARVRRRKSVLLVDDDEASREAGRAALEAAEVPVRTASTAAEALQSVSRQVPDVVVLEAALAGEPSGRVLVDRIRALPVAVGVPVVAYTRERVAGAAEARTTWGADAYVMKGPKGAEALVSQVITLFRGGR